MVSACGRGGLTLLPGKTGRFVPICTLEDIGTKDDPGTCSTGLASQFGEAGFPP